MTRTSGKPAKLDARRSTLAQKFALVFGLFLGLCVWKFGNPVILDHKISAPATPVEFLDFAWPPHWVNWILLPLTLIGAGLIFQRNKLWPQSQWLWRLPVLWLVWQFISATQTVDAELTTATLWQFSGCVACFFLGATLFASRPAQNFLFIGLLAAFTFCLVRAVDQRLFEFPLNHQLLVEGERSGWTNFPSATMDEMRRETIVINTNGMDVANPVILKKFANGRVSGTLVYPNALAGLILLLLPVSLALSFGTTQNLRPPIRFAAIFLVLFLGAAAFFWTGSKLGWLIGIGISGFWLLRLNWPKKFKLFALAAVLFFGLGIFTVRFHNYFSTGATSVGARFDYWRAAAQTTSAQPVVGTGPGTFQRPYAQLKSPDSEMARLTHNDFLEQFSDSGIFGGLAYGGWISLALFIAGKKAFRRTNTIEFAVFIGVLAWFIQGFGEFGLYIPATAWVAFTLLGCLFSPDINEFDKKTASR